MADFPRAIPPKSGIMVWDEVKYLETLGRRRTTLLDHREALVDEPFIFLDPSLELCCGSISIAGANAHFHHELDKGR